LEKSAEEKILGWTSLENVLDTDFQYSSYAWGDYLIFSLRSTGGWFPLPCLKFAFWKQKNNISRNRPKENRQISA